MAVDASANQFLQLSSIPVVDLRYFSQSELKTLSLCSHDSYDLRRSDDIVVPKIDRSIFNESAGSRKQTYSRLRLARRPSDVSSTLGSPRRRRRRSSVVPSPAPQPPGDTELRENAEIVSYLRNLFFSGAADNSTNSSVPPASAGGAARRRPGRRKACSSAVGGPADVRFEIVNRNGVVVDIGALASKEDLFGAELRRRTLGLATEADLVGFLNGLGGKWVSGRKKKMIVDASYFGDDLPRGWKLLLLLKKREGQVSILCRKYISPNGKHFESCKDVSSYLLSSFGPHIVSQPITTQIGERTNDISTAGLTLKDEIAKEESKFSSETPISSNASILSVSTEHEKQDVLLKAKNEVKAQEQELLECQMCKVAFDNKGALGEHLLSFHRKKPRVSSCITDGAITRDGKYECQFCHEIFDERHRYVEHVGIHENCHSKSSEALAADTRKQETNNQVPLALAPASVPKLDASVGYDKRDPESPITTFGNEQLVGSSYSEQSVQNFITPGSITCSSLTRKQEANDQVALALLPSSVSGLDASVGYDKKDPESSITTFGNEQNIASSCSEQVVENITPGSPTFGSLEIPPERLVSRSTDEHEMTDTMENTTSESPKGLNEISQEMLFGKSPNVHEMNATSESPKEGLNEISQEMLFGKSPNVHEMNTTSESPKEGLNEISQKMLFGKSRNEHEIDDGNLQEMTDNVENKTSESPKDHLDEISQEMLFGKSPNVHEMSDNKLQDPLESSMDLEAVPNLDMVTPLSTVMEDASSDTSQENDISVGNMHNEASESGHEAVRVLGRNATCDVANENHFTPTLLHDGIGKLANELERDPCKMIESDPGENANCPSRERNLLSCLLLDEISESGNMQDRNLGSHFVTEQDSEQSCVLETFANDFFSSIGKGSSSNATEKSGFELVSSFESCSTVLPNAGERCGMDRCVNGVEMHNGEGSLLNKIEQQRAQLEGSLQGSHSVAEVVTESGRGISEENDMENGACDTSLLLQQVGLFSIESNKGADAFDGASLKHGKLSDFEELRLDYPEPSQFGLMPGQESGSLPGDPMNLAYDVGFESDFDPSVQFKWDTVCMWCGLEFNLNGANHEVHSNSVGFICPNCKAKISARFNALDNGLSMNSDQL